MGRIRTIKPDFFFDEGLAALPHAVRLLFIGLWCLADKEGRLLDRPRFIGAQLFPYEKPDIDAMLNKLSPEWIVRYEAEGQKLIQINTFSKHQRIGNREPESTLPPCEADLSTLKHAGEEGKGREGKGSGKEVEGKGNGKEGKGVGAEQSETLSLPVFSIEAIGGIYEIRQEQISQWAETYPAVDIPAHIKRAVAWMDANPKQRKTVGGMGRFLTSWFGREQDRGGKRQDSQSDFDPFSKILGDRQ